MSAAAEASEARVRDRCGPLAPEGPSIDTAGDEQQRYLNRINDACADAIADGLHVVEATGQDLFVDIDGGSQNLNLFKKRAADLVSKEIAKSFHATRSKNGGWHGYVELREPMSVTERIALQCVLGSDLTHEYLSFLTYRKLGERTRIVFFEKEPDSRGKAETPAALVIDDDTPF